MKGQLLATRRQVLGPKHSDTTLAAWKLCFTLQERRDSAGALAVIQQDLAWLFGRDPAALTKDQRTIRDCAAEAQRKLTRWRWVRALFRWRC